LFDDLMGDEPSVGALDPSQFGVRAVEKEAEAPAPVTP
jgi:hypothetical protein